VVRRLNQNPLNNSSASRPRDRTGTEGKYSNHGKIGTDTLYGDRIGPVYRGGLESTRSWLPNCKGKKVTRILDAAKRAIFL